MLREEKQEGLEEGQLMARQESVNRFQNSIRDIKKSREMGER